MQMQGEGGSIPPGRRREFFGLFLIACTVGHWLVVVMLSQICVSVFEVLL